jgi:nucleotide-binding universal stress UspA family protein
MQLHRRPLVAVGRLADRRDYFESTWPEPLTVDRIVACVDDTPAADEAVRVGADWAQRLAMSLTILTVATPSVSLSDDDRTAPAEATVERLRGLVDAAAVNVSIHVVHDPIGPASGISAYLAEHPAGLVLVSTHARSGVERLVGGGTAADIVAAVRVACVVVPVR